ncbi:ADP-ribose pyrophosphatase YjhB (NUDIX family) [Bradyrhizobium sp. LM6.10]
MAAVVQPTHPQLAVSAAIFRDGKVLLTRRARSPAKGFYSLPGGRVEFGESLHQALAREVDEETALDIDIIGLAGWREVLPPPGGAGHYLIMSFAARWVWRGSLFSTTSSTITAGSPQRPWRASATSS